MTPNVRRAFHEALDIVLDAMAADDAAEFVKTPRKKGRGPAVIKVPDMPTLTEEQAANVARSLRQRGMGR